MLARWFVALTLAPVLAIGALIAVSSSDGPRSAAGVPFPTLPPHGVALVVNTTSDFLNPGDGTCSLRAAITATNANVKAGNCDAHSSQPGGTDGISFDIGGGTPVINVSTTTPLPAITDRLSIDGNTGGADRVELRGNGIMGPFGSGLAVAAGGNGTTISHLVIDEFYGSGIKVQANDVSILGSFLGTNSAGTVQQINVGNGIDVTGMGVHIGGTSGTTPGGPCTGDCNLISGNYYEGVFVETGATGAVVQGNLIGLDSAGKMAVPNADGLLTMAPGTVIGGSVSGARNVIAGNASTQIDVEALAATIRGNFVGTNSSGDAALLGQPVGSPDLILLRNATNSIIGGSSSGEGNLISGGISDGLIILQSSHVAVLGNLIGTAADGTTALGNGHGYGGWGIVIENGSNDNTIGGVAGGAGNTIAFNIYDGVVVQGNAASSGNAIRGNSIHDNVQKGISLQTGGNSQLPPPVVTTTAGSGASGTACATCSVDVYSDDADQGRIYEGSTTADGAGAWHFSGPIAGPHVTATATDAGGNTSEFSAAVSVPYPTPTPSPTPLPTPTPSPTPTATAPSSVTPTGTASANRIQGDFNCDGDVDQDDFDFLLDYAAGLNDGTQPDPCPDLSGAVPAAVIAAPLWGDVNCDASVNALDALFVLAHMAGIELNQPIGCTGIGHVIA